MKRSRVEQLDHLIAALGMLVAPLHEMAFNNEDVTARIPYERARFRTDAANLVAHVRDLGRIGNHRLDHECDRIENTIRDFENVFTQLSRRASHEKTRAVFESTFANALTAMRAIPVDDTDVILPAESPYATYSRLRAMCTYSAGKVQLFDPYLDASAFHRYLGEIPTNVQVDLVTSDQIMDVAANKGLNVSRRDRIVAVSELFAMERPETYRFLVTAQQHDRHLRIADTIFHLGGSIKDAAKNAPYTIGKLDPTQSNHAFLDRVLAGATPWWAHGMIAHRKA